MPSGAPPVSASSSSAFGGVTVCVPGSLGSIGEPGSSGLSGVPGLPGSPGSPGLPGSSGFPGSSGSSGLPGSSGFPGLPGSSGFPGLPGSSGFPGLPGSSGFPGLPGLPGLCGWPLAHSLPNAGFSPPTTLTLLPHAFTGTFTGAWTLFPDATPGELAAAPLALAPLDLLTHLFPNDGFSAPTTFTVLPHAFTGTLTGACTLFPDATPGELVAAPCASAPVCAWANPPPRASTPPAAATMVRPFRVTCRIAGSLPSGLSVYASGHSARRPNVHRPRSAWRALRGRPGSDP
ncbi:hypothetical protein E2C00_29525 [Streptomyces sp. WAC05374]|nr:hypothetical protein EF905_17930 [Streptomyces sp. WAC05374]TDF40616.1 hypothetical protein E2B92_23560 [Streptomyces sp. WAC05374]TDF49475.1 hypothetical protein E2C00_29525 [Streptomyces sp. WAC05374]TDF49832.1 hypothetical protein E2C02_25175 [Streptomyces sp. WAC05374]